MHRSFKSLLIQKLFCFLQHVYLFFCSLQGEHGHLGTGVSSEFTGSSRAEGDVE